LLIRNIKGLFFLPGGTKYSLIWRICLNFWLIFFVALAVKALLIPGRQSVFEVYVSGVKHWWQDQSLYAKYPGIDYFRYAPSAVFLFEPFVRCGLILGPMLWGCISVFSVFFACNQMAGKFWITNQPWAIGTILALLSAFSGLWNHQSNAIIGCLLILATLQIYNGNFLIASFLFAIGLVLKITVFPVIALVIFSNLFSMSWRLLLFVLIFGFLPFLTRAPDTVIWQYGEWARHLHATQDIRWPGYRDGWYIILSIAEWTRSGNYNPSFWDCSPPLLYKILQVATGLGCLVLTIGWKALPSVEWYPRTLAFGLAWLMVFGPATELPTYGLIAPIFCWAYVKEFSKSIVPKIKYQSFILKFSLFFVSILSIRDFTIGLAPIFPPVLAAAPFGIILFAIWLFRDSQQEICSLKSSLKSS
jgi:hypothetical protein